MINFIVYALAGLGAGVGTGLAGLSAAVVISPMLIVILGFDPFEAVGIALAADVLASAVSTFTYSKNKNVDFKKGSVMLIPILVCTILGSYLASLAPSKSMGDFSILITIFLGLRFIFMPISKTKTHKASNNKNIKVILFGIPIGFICGFIGAGGGMMMLFILTDLVGYSLKKAVGTSVFIMTFTALIGSVSHFAIGSMPDITALMTCLIFTLIGAQVSSKFANVASVKTQNRVTGIVLTFLGISMLVIDKLSLF